MMMAPSSERCRSKLLMDDIERFIAFFQSIPDICSARARLYQLRAKMAIRPFAGVCTLKRQRSGRARSSSLGEPIECMEKPRGSRNWISSLMTIVIPEAFHPSTTMMVEILWSRRDRCRTPICCWRGSMDFSKVLSSVFFVRSYFSNKRSPHSTRTCTMVFGSSNPISLLADKISAIVPDKKKIR